MLAVACAISGAAIGSLLPLTAYRLAVESGVRSVCGSCGLALTGWLNLRRCAGCGRRLGPPAVAMGAAAGAGCLAVSLRPHRGPLLVVLLLVAVVGVLLAAVDVAVLRLPDVVVLPTAIAVGALLAATPSAPVVRALSAAAAMAAGYAALAVLPRSMLGFGDVKLAAVLGMPLGWLGWPTVLRGALLPIVLGGLAALVSLATGRVRRDTPMPFGPALIAGFLLAVSL